MSERTLELPAAPNELEALVEDAAVNGEIVLTRDGTAVAKIVPLQPQTVQPDLKKTRTFGSARGLGFVPDDFDEPLDDLKDYMQA
jgi:antitoxin (DNA-binding transcriptional repressor) of toxin-antitoxin stability system